MINFGHLYMMFDFSGHNWSCAVWKSFNQLSSWWLLCKRYAYTSIRVSRHYYVIRMFLLCLCIFVSNKAFWSWSWSWSFVTHVPWCMSELLTSGFPWSWWRENCPDIPGACATHNFTYRVRSPYRITGSLISTGNDSSTRATRVLQNH